MYAYGCVYVFTYVPYCTESIYVHIHTRFIHMYMYVCIYIYICSMQMYNAQSRHPSCVCLGIRVCVHACMHVWTIPFYRDIQCLHMLCNSIQAYINIGTYMGTYIQAEADGHGCMLTTILAFVHTTYMHTHKPAQIHTQMHACIHLA